MTTITLTEFQPAYLAEASLSVPQATRLWQHHRHQIVVEPPSFKTDGQWQLTAQGWIGFLPLAPDLTFLLVPKMPLRNLFGLLAYAYQLDEIAFGGSLLALDSVDGFVDRLAWHFARLVQRQAAQGLYQSYVESTAALPYIRGQLDVNALFTRPLQMDIPCRYEELTTDGVENQLIAWTLTLLSRNTLCTATSLTEIRRALSQVEPFVSIRPLAPAICGEVTFHRLNQSYRPLIALCRFFLEHCGPHHRLGVYPTPSFLVNSAQLFERFVAAWLQAHLHERYRLQIQERHAIGSHQSLHFAIDLLLYDRRDGQALIVMDTKYKVPTDTPDTRDISQVVAYAEAVGAPEAVLIYPAPLAKPLDEQIGRIRVRSLSFNLVNDWTVTGQQFLKELLT